MRKYIVLVLLMVFVSVHAATAAPVQWSVNGHYYERIDPSVSITWDQARSAANAMSYAGYQGHLVTITSAEENLFLTNNSALGDGETSNFLHYHWTGGYQPVGSTEPNGGWSWVTGEAFNYNNWGGFYDPYPNITRTEPNNSFGTEDRMVFDGGFLADGKCWNDLTGSWEAGSYVVEYDGLKDTASVPEPTTMLLLGLGLMGIVPIRKKLLR